jgi:hypothetical protein
MKSYNELVKKFKPEEIAQSFVFPANKRNKEKSLDLFREHRKKADLKRTSKDKLISKLLQLRFLMEDYVQTDTFDKEFSFGYFLEEYINRLDKRKKIFAKEIGIDPTELSQIINKHRPPNEKFCIRLELHSNSNFPAPIWFKVIEKEKIFELINNRGLRDSESKHVKSKLQFSF